MSLEDDMTGDVDSVFLNEHEFASRHVVEGKENTVVFYNEDMVSPHAEFGLIINRMTLQGKRADLPAGKRAGQTLKIDGRLYMIQNIRSEMGMLVFTLTENS